MKRGLTIAQKGLVLVSVPLIFELCFLIVITIVLNQAQQQLENVSISREVVAHVDNVAAFLAEGTSIVATYRLLGRHAARRHYETVLRNVVEEFRILQGLLHDRPAELAQLNILEQKTVTAFGHMQDLLGRRGIKSVRALRVQDAAKELTDETMDIGMALKALVKNEGAIENQSPHIRELVRQRLRTSLIVGLLVIAVITFILARYFISMIAARLKLVQDNSVRMAGGVALAPPISGNDEITDLDQAFHRAARELEEFQKSRRRLTAVIACRLESPLARVQDIIREFLGGTLVEKTRNRLEAASESGQRLVRLIADLDALKNESPAGGELEKQKTDLEAIFKPAAASVADLANKQKVSLTVESLPISLKADRDRLIQVVVNLLSNAIKFSPEGSGVKLSAALESGVLAIRVTDQGRGIAPEMQAKIFERFEQVDASDATVRGGSGLGLSICKKIVEQHGGSIAVESEPGKGSTFIVRLPQGDAQ